MSKRKLNKEICILVLMVLTCVPVAWAQTGALSLLPASDTYAVDAEFDVQIVLDTGGETVLTVQTYIDFDPTMVEIVGGDAGITVDAAFILIVEKKVDLVENKIKIVAGALGGVTDAAKVFATVKLKGLKKGSADIKFDQAQTEAQKATTENVVGTYNDATYTINGVVPPTRWDFDSDAEGWKFSGKIKTLDPPTDTVADGALNMTATNNTNTFGFWYSPVNGINELKADSLYRILFGIKSDQPDKSLVPSCRIRWNASNEKQSDLIMINSKMGGEASPGTTVQDYHIYMRPQGASLDPAVTGYLSFDIVNINPNDAADAKVSLDYAEWKRIDISSAGTSTTKATYTFDVDKEGWTSTDPIAPYEKPIFTHDPVNGYLVMQCADNNNTFGFYQNPHEGGSEIVLDVAKLYQLRVKAGAGTGEAPKILAGDPPLMRIRMYDHPSNQMCAMFQSPVWTDYITPAGGKQVTTKDFYAYFHNPLGVGPTLGIAVDIVNLDPEADPNGLIAIDEVELSTFNIPSF